MDPRAGRRVAAVISPRASVAAATALLAALLGAPSTVFVDYLYGLVTFGSGSAAFLDRFAVWWGAPYPLLIVVLFIAPLVAGRLLAHR